MTQAGPDSKQMHSEMNKAFAEVEPLLVNRDLAPLLWYLIEVFELTAEEAQDAICDASGDKGIDALLVDDEDECVYVFQSKRKKKAGLGTGDTALKELDGTLTQLSTKAGVSKLLTTAAPGVRKLLQDNDIETLVSEGYELRGVLVSNMINNKDTRDVLELAKAAGTNLDSIDVVRLHRSHTYAKAPGFVDTEAVLRTSSTNAVKYELQDGVAMHVCLVPAKDLVALPGIDDESLFAHNVRLHLGNTRINRAIEKTVKNESGDGFPAFHNGLTLVTRVADRTPHSRMVRIKHFSVVNGCQSIKTLAANARSLDPDMKVLVKLIVIGPQVKEKVAQELIQKITTRSNNQNSINMQDLRSGDKKQRSLKAEFAHLFNGDYEYVIMRGERIPGGARPINNDLAAQCLISLYDERPHLAHRKFSLFDSEYHRVFDRKIHAEQVLLSCLVYDAVSAHLDELSNESAEVYRLTRFVLVNAVGAILRLEPDGRILLAEPSKYVVDAAKRANVVSKLDDLAYEAAVGLWAYLQDKQGPGYDFKDDFKSSKGVKAIATEAVKTYKLSARKNKSTFKLG